MTQTIPGWAARDGVGHAPTLLETVPGGHLVAKAREAEGADTVHTRCGGHIIDSYDGCTDDGMAVVDALHEQVAAFARAAFEKRPAPALLRPADRPVPLRGRDQRVPGRALDPRRRRRRHRAGPPTRPPVGPPVSHQCLERPGGLCAGNYEPDDVQVTVVQPLGVRK